MKIVKQDKVEHEKQKKAREKKTQEQERRYKYLERMRKNRQFQKYIVKEIILDKISSLSDINNIPNSDDDEAVAKNIRANKMAQTILKGIVKELL